MNEGNEKSGTMTIPDMEGLKRHMAKHGKMV